MKLVMMSGTALDDHMKRAAVNAGFDTSIDKAYDFTRLEQLLSPGGTL